MWVVEFLAGEIASEFFKKLITIARKACFCRSTAEQLKLHIRELLPIVDEIKNTGVDLTQARQIQLDTLYTALLDGHELAGKVLAAPAGRWHPYKNIQISLKMEKVEKTISRFLKGILQAHILADMHHMRREITDRLDPFQGSARLDEIDRYEGSLVKVGMELGKRKIKDMILDRDDMAVIGINGIGGCGKIKDMILDRDDMQR